MFKIPMYVSFSKISNILHFMFHDTHQCQIPSGRPFQTNVGLKVSEHEWYDAYLVVVD